MEQITQKIIHQNPDFFAVTRNGQLDNVGAFCLHKTVEMGKDLATFGKTVLEGATCVIQHIVETAESK